jgi:RNA 3'-terminal phosphate cyclase
VIEIDGAYGEGGGRLEARLVSSEPPYTPMALREAGPLIAVHGRSHAARILAPRRVAERQAEAAGAVLAALGVPVEIATEYGDTPARTST